MIELQYKTENDCQFYAALMILREYLNIYDGEFNMAATVTPEPSFISDQNAIIHKNLGIFRFCVKMLTGKFPSFPCLDACANDRSINNI